MPVASFLLWAALLVVAIFYVRRAEHPRQKPVAAYFVFILAFSVAAMAIFGALTWLLAASGYAEQLHHPAAAVMFLALIFVPAFFVGRWQLKKPPRAAPPID